jgi:hypothetical protein
MRRAGLHGGGKQVYLEDLGQVGLIRLGQDPQGHVDHLEVCGKEMEAKSELEIAPTSWELRRRCRLAGPLARLR